jgi:hypothetical protein
MHSLYLLVIRKGSPSNCDTGCTSSTINIHSALINRRRASRVSGIKGNEFRLVRMAVYAAEDAPECI